MIMRTGWVIWILLVTLVVIGCSTTNANRGSAPVALSERGRFSQDNAPTYSWLKKNIFGKFCVYCHTGRPPFLLNYNSIMTVVTPGDPANSRLFYMVSTGRMPKGGAHLSQEKTMAIYYWIANGAKND